MVLSILLAILLLSLIDNAHTAEIIRQPDTQYVLMDENATFECHTARVSEAHWDINETPVSLTFPDTIQEYKDRGVIFKEDISLEYYNLTMIIPTSLDFNNTEVTCVAISSDFSFISSRKVHLIIFDTLRPYRPSFLITEVIYSELQPMVHITLSEPPRWPGYEISEFRMNITKQGDSSFLHQINTGNVTENYTVDIYEPLESAMIDCDSLIVSASAVSSLYGESEISQYHTPIIYKAPGIFPENGLNLTTFHYLDGVPFPFLQIKLPDVCVNQPINYTFIIESNEMDAGIILEGPYFHIGSGLVPHCVNGVIQQRNYSIFVQVTSIAGSSESDKLYFDTYNINEDTLTHDCQAKQTSTTEIGNENVKESGQAKQTATTEIGNEYIKEKSATNTIAMTLGVMVALLSLVLLAVCIMFLFFCAYHYISNKKAIESATEYNMMPHPESTYENAVPIPEPVYVNTAKQNL